jgi:hypothetical protein
MTTDEKCKAILQEIAERCKDENNSEYVIAFAPDWGLNTLTILINDNGHSHCGVPGGNFETMIEHLYNLLCRNTGLSFA